MLNRKLFDNINNNGLDGEFTVTVTFPFKSMAPELIVNIAYEVPTS